MWMAAKKGFWAELLGVSDFYYEVSPSCAPNLSTH